MQCEDTLTPFMINASPVRGRFIRLGISLDTILSRHAYPERVSRLLAETLVISGMLASNLKQDGLFTVQVQSKGGVSLLVVDAAYGGAVRGYAQFDEEAVATLEGDGMASIFGEGYLAITLDPGDGGQRYQGVVPLEGDSISDAVQRYFIQSQQLDVCMKVAVGMQHMVGDDDVHWVAGGIYIEKMPDEDEADIDAWPRNKVLLETVRDDELLDKALSGGDLLHRLFHEDGVWVYEEQVLKDECRCSRDKIEKTLSGMEAAAIDEMAMDGEIEVVCQFCNKAEKFNPSDIKHLSSQ